MYSHGSQPSWSPSNSQTKVEKENIKKRKSRWIVVLYMSDDYRLLEKPFETSQCRTYITTKLEITNEYSLLVFIFVSFCQINQATKGLTCQKPIFPHQLWIQQGFLESTSSAYLMQLWAGPLEPCDPHHGPVFITR